MLVIPSVHRVVDDTEDVISADDVAAAFSKEDQVEIQYDDEFEDEQNGNQQIQQLMNEQSADWKPGTKCDVFDREQRKWTEGVVIGSFFDEKGKWVKVQYGKHVREILSDDPDLRVRDIIQSDEDDIAKPASDDDAGSEFGDDDEQKEGQTDALPTSTAYNATRRDDAHKTMNTISVTGLQGIVDFIENELDETNLDGENNVISSRGTITDLPSIKEDFVAE